MIQFTCPKCGAPQSAPETEAGHLSACACGEPLVVPQASGPRPGSAPPAPDDVTAGVWFEGGAEPRKGARPQANPEPTGPRPPDTGARAVWVIALVAGGVMAIFLLVVLILTLAGEPAAGKDGGKPAWQGGPMGDAARAGLMNLTRAVEAYEVQHKMLPPNLEMLTLPNPDGRPPVVRAQDLIDPWGRPYLYNPQQRHPQTGRPLIQSFGPNGNPATAIRNWDF